MIGTFFKLVGKAFRYSISRPLQRFNIYNRAKKYLGEDAKYFMPAPRAIGSLSLKQGPSQYPHLEGGSAYKSIKQRRLDAIGERNKKLIEKSQEVAVTSPDRLSKAFSEIKQDDDLVVETSSRLPVIKTVTLVENRANSQNELEPVQKSSRPLPSSTNLQLQDPSVIWQVDKVPAGRLSLQKLQELLINKLADDKYWTPKQISETYNIKEEYAEKLITHLKQIRIIVSPRLYSKLEYVARNDPVYQATKNIIYIVDNNLRTDFDKQCDDTFLPTDQLDPKVRELLDASSKELQQHQLEHNPDLRLTKLFKRPEPLKLASLNKQADDETNSVARKVEQKSDKQISSGKSDTKDRPERDVT